MIRAGVIGAGHLGAIHGRKYVSHRGVTLAGVCDIDPFRGEKVARELETEYFKDFRDLVEKVDILSVAVPTVLHYEISRYCLRKRKHLLIEKPITEKVWQAKRLIYLAEEMNLVLQVGHLERFNPALIRISSYIHDPGFIEAERISPFTERSTDIDVILDLMIHDIDLILSFVKSPIKRVNAIGVPVLSKKTDIANARVLFESGCVANITASRVSMNRTRKIRIFQEDCYFSIDFMNRNIKVVRMSEASGRKGKELSGEFLETEEGDPLMDEVRNFVSSVHDGRTPRVTGYDGLKALEAAYKIIRKL